MCRWLLPVTTPSRSDRLQRQCDTGAGRGGGAGRGEGQGEGEGQGSGDAIGQGEMETYQTMVDIGRCTGTYPPPEQKCIP